MHYLFRHEPRDHRRCIGRMHVDCLAEFRSTVPEIHVFGHRFVNLPRPEIVELPGIET